MKNFFVIALFSVSFLISGCSKFSEPTKQVQNIFFEGEGVKVELITIDMWQSAVMTDNKGDAYALKVIPSANGIYLVDKDGVSIHFRDGDGAILEYEKDKPLFLEEKGHQYLN
ncbi:MAG: hypothetical protein GXZ15_00310 [Campylobacter sp.]|nr:hypothetical protein [Campylobacter sp.]